MPKGEGQSRKRRGRYGSKKKAARKSKAGAQIVGRSDREQRHHEAVAQRFRAYMEATAPSEKATEKMDELELIRLNASRESAAMQLAFLEVRLLVLSEQEAIGDIVADEGRTIPGLSREIRVLRAELGLNSEPADDDEEEL